MLQLNVPRPSLANLYKSLFPWCLVGKINHLAKPAKIKQGDLKLSSGIPGSRERRGQPRPLRRNCDPIRPGSSVPSFKK
ncbi:hypothetical protein GWI33_000064 [Rhynchophorus ferrugineus]|uniref:Uncharacterized protein n=1 Tax=Rhynchophorus ferrugineus TaxID=354439 RepID=A0A834IXE9_RHYFE|nr:hypothetical protein GWI33_000064 [Rhynchophorus ferrugineus]